MCFDLAKFLSTGHKKLLISCRYFFRNRKAWKGTQLYLADISSGTGKEHNYILALSQLAANSRSILIKIFVLVYSLLLAVKGDSWKQMFLGEHWCRLT